MTKSQRAKIERKAAATVAARHAAPILHADESASETAALHRNLDSSRLSNAASVGSSTPGITPDSGGQKKMELTRTNHDRKGSSIVFALGEGYRGTVKFARSVFGDSVPETLTLEGNGFATPGSKAKSKMTKEERAAERAKMTPQDKVKRAREIAARAAQRAAKLEAALSA